MQYLVLFAIGYEALSAINLEMAHQNYANRRLEEKNKEKKIKHLNSTVNINNKEYASN